MGSGEEEWCQESLCVSIDRFTPGAFCMAIYTAASRTGVIGDETLHTIDG